MWRRTNGNSVNKLSLMLDPGSSTGMGMLHNQPIMNGRLLLIVVERSCVIFRVVNSFVGIQNTLS
jgi:hypothetical protein